MWVCCKSALFKVISAVPTFIAVTLKLVLPTFIDAVAKVGGIGGVGGVVSLSESWDMTEYGGCPPIIWKVCISVTRVFAEAGCVCSSAFAGQGGVLYGKSMVIFDSAALDWLSSTVTVAV